MGEKFKKLTEKLNNKRKILLIKTIEENNSYVDRLKKVKKELKKNHELGLQEEIEVNKEEMKIFVESLEKNVQESYLLMESVYGNNQTFMYN